MEATAIIAIVEGAVSILEQVAPFVEQEVQKGTITVSQQQAIYNSVQALRNAAASFGGPEWQVKG
jgi:hypothetical protein